MDTRDRLIDSTQQLLWERGYVGTSPAAILERAQVGQGSMYHFFRGKGELARVAMERTAQEQRDAIAPLLAPPGTAIERLGSYLRRDRDVLKGCPVGRMALDPEIYDDMTASATVDDYFRWLVSAVAAVLEEGRATGELAASMPAVAVATTLVAALQGGYVLARAAHDRAPFDDAVDGALALLAGFVQAGARA